MPRMFISGPEQNKNRLKKRLLHQLYIAGQASIPQMARMLSVSIPTVKNLIVELLESDEVKSAGIGESNGGRKPELYELQSGRFHVVACDMGRYMATMAVYNCRNQQVGNALKIRTNYDDPDLIEKLVENYYRIIKENNLGVQHIYGFGIDMPGLIDSKHGINYTIKNRRNQNIRKALEKHISTYIYIDNDARMQAFGELRFGKAKGKKDVIRVHWSWGLGLGMILDGKLYSGSTGFAGELSHIKLEDGGELCICGKRGCLETEGSATSLMREVRKGVMQNVVSVLTTRYKDNLDAITPEIVIDAARAGDEFAILQLNHIGMALGKGLSILIQLLNPEIIIIGGPLSSARQFVLTPIQQALNRYCLEKISQNIPVEISELDENAGLLGVTACLFDTIFSENHTMKHIMG